MTAMREHKPKPIGIEDFKSLREKYYFNELEGDAASYNFRTRPLRLRRLFATRTAAARLSRAAAALSL